MPRRDDYDGDDRPRPKKRDNTLVYILLAVGGLMLAGCGGVGALVLFGWSRATQDVHSVDEPREAGLAKVTREEFRQAVIGKTPEEVIKAVGKPDRTSNFVGRENWIYEARTFDPVTGKPDEKVSIWFENGRVDTVNF